MYFWKFARFSAPGWSAGRSIICILCVLYGGRTPSSLHFNSDFCMPCLNGKICFPIYGKQNKWIWLVFVALVVAFVRSRAEQLRISGESKRKREYEWKGERKRQHINREGGFKNVKNTASGKEIVKLRYWTSACVLVCVKVRYKHGSFDGPVGPKWSWNIP